MSDSLFGPLRIWNGDPPSAGRSAGPASSLIERLVFEEVLRPSALLREPAEMLSLAWYQELERLRYHRQGRWMPALLDFAKCRGERLLGLGTTLGSDLVNFTRQGAEVVVAAEAAEQLALVRRNFELRRLEATFLHADPAALPIESGSIDVVHIAGLLHEAAEPARLVDEIYRVLKPGGKLLALIPARDPFARAPWLSRLFCPAAAPPGRSAGRLDRAGVRGLLERFHGGRIYRRHLRRADVPHICRWLPLGLLERITGRLFLFKGFKPVSAARAELAAA